MPHNAQRSITSKRVDQDLCPGEARFAQWGEGFLPSGLAYPHLQKQCQICIWYVLSDSDHVFDDKASTDYIYDIAAKQIVQQAFHGFNGTV